MKKISDIGEFDLIQGFSRQFTKNLPDNVSGIGDDCSIVPFNNSESVIVTTDLLIEDIHFLTKNISPKELGHKALAVNLSDIAAMGGVPEWAHLSIGLPKSTEIAWIDQFFSGIAELANKYNTRLLGGDTTKSPDKIVINFTLSGKCKNSEIKKRSAAKKDDVICLTGFVGDSAAGLQTILRKKLANAETKYLQNKHNKPEPHINEGRFLAQSQGTNAMIDLSDGIESDIQHIIKASSLGAEINIERLPLSEPFIKTAEKNEWNTNNLALSGGEDYILLATIDKNKFEKIASNFQQKFGKSLYRIGKITEKKGQKIFKLNNTIINRVSRGFDHFSI